ncbi:uncharacterized protein LOC106474990 [Limulus polyphemus]|uniref:Uncharacterized protein LOC106474990 n=1 Tax=Limulus polyphemus TaxID=6850 RepID=A0ABM1BYL1_LIMPO|nr:uncharacterized protein LOC106474990 [Limulus polyphemus]
MISKRFFVLSAVLLLCGQDAVGIPLLSRIRRYLGLESDVDVPSVFLTVSSLASKSFMGKITYRQLELNWHSVPSDVVSDQSTWVGLFDHDPEKNIGDALEKVYTSESEEDHYETKVSYHRPEFLPGNLTDACQGYWIGLVYQDRLLASNCIRGRPNWMYEMRDVIGDQTLLNVMLPGTHNSGSHQEYDSVKDHIISRYQICQDEDVWNQLVYGIRFLDLRIGWSKMFNSSEQYWIYHDSFRSQPSLREVLKQIRQFLDATNEILIVDFHRFTSGFGGRLADERHQDVMTMIIEEIGEYMLPLSSGLSTTLNDMWKTNKRVLVGYGAPQRVESNLLFQSVSHLWANKDTLEGLENYLNNGVCKYKYNFLWAAMASLTPQTLGVILDKYGGLRQMAQDVNGPVTRWFRERWWHCANVVATDFFLGNNLIEVSIDANRKRYA